MSFNLASIQLDTTIVDSTLGLMIMGGEQQQGDSFSPAVPADRLSTLNWTVEGTVSVYAADMTLIKNYGPGERMLVPNPDHLAMRKCVLVCTSANLAAMSSCLLGSSSLPLRASLISLASSPKPFVPLPSNLLNQLIYRCLSFRFCA